MLGLLITTTLLAGGCRRGPYLWVRQERYQPALPPYMVKSYRGRSIHLMDFVNRTPSRWYFYSPDGTITYEAAPTLPAYLKACFAKGLASAGVQVLPEAAMNVPSLRVILQRLTDEQMVLDAYLYRNQQTIFRKRFSVLRGPVRSHDKQHLEQMAFYQINLAIARVFMDRQFWSAFFGASTAPQPAAPTPSGPGTTTPPTPSTPSTPPPGTPPGTKVPPEAPYLGPGGP